MKSNSILITGSSGFIGQYLSLKFSKNFCVIGIDTKSLKNNYCDYFYNFDIRDEEKIKKIFENHKIDYVIHSAAAKDLSWCESNKKEAYNINFTSTIKLFNLSRKNKAKFIYISSDQVFNGKSKNSKEDSDKNPINYYGTLKNMAEEKIIGFKDVAICRTAMVFGNILQNQIKLFNKTKNDNILKVQSFVVQHLVYRLSKNQRIILPKDEYCNPTSNMLLFKQIRGVIKKDLSGILHLCGGERVSRYGFGKKIAKAYNLDISLIDPLQFNNPLRPKDVSMNFRKTQKKLEICFSKVTDMIQQIKEEANHEDFQYFRTGKYNKSGE